MRSLPLEDDARAVLKPYFALLHKGASQAIEAAMWRREQDMRAGYDENFSIYRTWDVWRYALSVFTRLAVSHPGMKIRSTRGTFLITIEEKYELWVRLVDHELMPAPNRTEGSTALLQNGELEGFTLPTLVLGYRFNATHTGLGSLNVICTGKKGKRVWAINVLDDESTGAIPFQVAPLLVAPSGDGREIRAKEGLSKRAKLASDGTTGV